MIRKNVSFSISMAILAAGFVVGGEAVPNWPVPPTWTPSRSGGVHTMTDITGALPFIGVSPCRVADTRGNGFTGDYGPPALAANAQRSFTITGQCGIPANAQAVSFNFTALNVGGSGDLRVFPAGSTIPLVSTLNYNPNTPNIANAAIVPLGTGGAITVQADAIPIDFLIHVNGYFTQQLNPNEFFEGSGNCGCAIILGINSGTHGYPTSGVRGIVLSTGGLAAGVVGEAGATNAGFSYGVLGINSSTVAAYPAGVAGFDESGGLVFQVANLSNQPAGVYGSSFANVGVDGDSTSAGVRGRAVDKNGVVLNSGILGSDSYGVFSSGDYGGTGAKYFIEPHATDPGKIVRFVALEGNESGTYFRGSSRTVNGTAVIEVPGEFRMVTDEEGLTVQLTPVGSAASLYIASEDLNAIVVRSSRDVKFHYQVNGIRKAYKNHQPIVESEVFMPYASSALPLASYPAEIRQRLIANGTYNPDGSVNLDTARRLGWTRPGEQAAEPGPLAQDKKPALE